MPDDPSTKDFGATFQRFMKQMAQQAPAEEPYFRHRLREHFGRDPSKLSIVGETFPTMDHANVHLAVEAFTTAPGRETELIGISSEAAQFGGMSLSLLVSQHGARGALSEGPVSYKNIPLADNRVLACLQLGLIMIRDGEARLALLVDAVRSRMGGGIVVEVLASDHDAAASCLAWLRTKIRRDNVYRGQIVSLSAARNGELQVGFHHLPKIERAQIILPAGLLERIERHSAGFASHADRLRAAGRHLKRGLLLHGAPGTGKTLTAMYLAALARDRTVLVITGRGMGLLEQACAMARVLQPATIILEDVDLIAEERTAQGSACAPLLFELLNQMDGIADDADLLFILTTNRADRLEPALAARPGRIDQAIEVPVPDADCRRRLFALYGDGLAIDAPLDGYIARTAGASAAFIRELLRRAALFAADDGAQLIVRAAHFDAALHEMVVQGGDLTRSLLGGPAPTASPGTPS